MWRRAALWHNKTMLNFNEDHLIKAARQGDRGAIAALYRQYVDAIFRYVSYRIPEPSTAEDLTAEVFLRMVEGLPRFEINGAPFEAWLYRIAAARVADFYREKTRHPRAVLSGFEITSDPSPEGRVQSAEEQAEVRAALRQLSEEHQTILLLRFVERKSHADVARIVGKSVSAVKSAQHRALSQLADLMGAETKARHYLRGLYEA